MSAELVAVATLAIWLYLLLGRGFFWLAAERDDELATAPDAAPTLAVRHRSNSRPQRGRRRRQTASARCFARPIPAASTIVLVDDESTDGTAAVARERGESGRRRQIA